MGQAEVLEFLEEKYKQNSSRWYGSKEIVKDMEITRTTVSVSLRKLRKRGTITFRHKAGFPSIFEYRYHSIKPKAIPHTKV